MQLKKIPVNFLKKLFIALLVFGFLYSVYDGFHGKTYEQELAADSAKQNKVTSTKNEIKEEPLHVRAQLQPLVYTTLSSEIPARIQKLPLHEGQAFKKGQLLVKLDCSLQEAQLLKAKASKEATERTYNANKGLFKLDAIGKIELENSFSESEKARGEFIYMTTTVSKCNIFAPFDGKVAEQKAREEQYIQPGQALLDILDAKEMELEFLIPSKWLAWLSEESAISIHVDETNRDYPAKILRIGAKTDAISQSVKVTAIIANFPELSPGMSGEVKFNMPEETNKSMQNGTTSP